MIKYLLQLGPCENSFWNFFLSCLNNLKQHFKQTYITVRVSSGVSYNKRIIYNIVMSESCSFWVASSSLIIYELNKVLYTKKLIVDLQLGLVS